jgi:predicted glycogen debranching enzyme
MQGYRFETYGELNPWIGKEWLLTNGTGGFASGTIVNCNTRRYHGLLVAATLPPVGRVMTLSRLAETVFIGSQATGIELSVNYFDKLTIPRGERYLRRFAFDDIPKWEYEADGVRITKELVLAWGKSVVGIRYHVDPGPHTKVVLRTQPFVALRDFHALLKRSPDRMYEVAAGANHVSVALDKLKLHLKADASVFEQRGDWWYGHTYPIENERGQDDREDLFTPGHFSWTFTSAGSVTLWAALGNGNGQTNGSSPLDGIDFDTERKRHTAGLAVPEMPTPAQRRLARSASDFLAKRKVHGSAGTTILAGFPWFSDWGRDSMIALPGLLLSTRRFQQAGQVLSVFAGHVSDGMVPNYFDDYTNEPSYNTVDASLWFIHAAHEYLRISRDKDTFDSILEPACNQIIEGYHDGTRYNIKMDPYDGLITAGDPTSQLTWMDAKQGDTVFTPRHGKAVEINALWYHALVLQNQLDLAAKVKDSFSRAFWISPFRGLADVVLTDGSRDASCRPNQIFAVSLPNSPLSDEQKKIVVDVVRKELLTPVGLRTLAPFESKYQGKYTGVQFNRDRAYHNGTIWPWLIGPFLEAFLRVNGKSQTSRDQARAWLNPLVWHMEEGCLGSISECFEADPPHRPVAACAQAWSVAEVLRLAVELEM